MCWLGKCDVKIAKRDFYVYKLGSVSDKIIYTGRYLKL